MCETAEDGEVHKILILRLFYYMEIKGEVVLLIISLFVEQKTYASEKIIAHCTYKRVYVCVNCPQSDSNIYLFLLGRLAWFVC